jgi:ATP-dependent Clp endopeptidase proteolytic subunit ClpP
VQAADDKKTAEVYIYDRIGAYSVSAQSFVEQWKALKGMKQIDLHVNCPGGNVVEGFAIYNIIKQTKANVTAYVDGFALSIASFIIMAAKKIHIAENGQIMIHNPAGYAEGDAEALRKQAETLDRIKQSELGIYAKRTGKTEDEIAQLMDEETWFSGQEAVDQGFADEVFTAAPMTACFDLTGCQYKNLPPEISQLAEDDEPAQADNKKEAETMADTPAVTPSAPAPVDPEQIRQEVLKQERDRVTAIQQAAFDGQDDLVAKFIQEGTDALSAALQLKKAFQEKGAASLQQMAAASAGIDVQTTPPPDKPAPPAKEVTQEQLCENFKQQYIREGKDEATATRMAKVAAGLL